MDTTARPVQDWTGRANIELSHVASPLLDLPGLQHSLATHPLPWRIYPTCVHYFVQQKTTVITTQYGVQNDTVSFNIFTIQEEHRIFGEYSTTQISDIKYQLKEKDKISCAW